MADNFDKFYPDWVVGTLTLVSGSRNFTATNAQLTLAAIREGDTIITPGGLTLPIESINANGNGGVLAQNAPAGAAGTYATRIRYQSDNSRFTGMLAALVARMAGGNLQSLAGLTGAADKGIMFTGPGTAGTFDLTALGRAILALTGTNGNIPVMTGAGSVASRPIVGTVSAANNALMETGNNANGFYFRFANRLQVCFNRELVLNGVSTYQVFNTWTFPAAFNSYNVSFFGSPRSTGGRGAWANGYSLGTGDWGALNFSVIASNFASVDVALNKITAAANIAGTPSMPVHVAAIGFY